jgi:hypothetical protein
VTERPTVAELFLAGAEMIATAIADPSVAGAWDLPSVLEGQQVSGLAGHLARTGGWAVADYLDAGTPAGPVDYGSAGEYFAGFANTASPDDHRTIRDRGAAVASVGRDELLRTLHERLADLGPRLLAAEPDRLIAVIGGRVMRLADYLATRIVEQTVHLDDLARSVGRDPWPLPAEAEALTIAVGVDIARRRRGATAVVRALYREGLSETTLPVL